jgi:tRNA pseudouridine synthase 9
MAAACTPPPPEYVRAGGFRHVVPYEFTWHTTAKGRWMGRPLLDVLADEFRGFSRAYYASALAAGAILLNGRPAAGGERVGMHDVVSHVAHRHEPPVVDAPLVVTPHAPPGGGAGDILAVCKPASWPMHPGGGFRKNTLLYVLEAEHGLGRGAAAGEGEGTREGEGEGGLHLLFRLDRLVSGLCLLATSAAAAAAARAALREPSARKVYLARVHGLLHPAAFAAGAAGDGDVRVQALGGWAAALAWLGADAAPALAGLLPRGEGEAAGGGAGGGGATALPPHLITLRHPIREVAGMHGRFAAGPRGGGGGKAKEAHTEVLPLWADAASGTTTLLLLPVTGRTHQLRVHLQGVGFPIANDPVYGGHPRWLADAAGGTVPRGAAPAAVAPLRAAVARQAEAAGAVTAAALQRCPHCAAFEARFGGGDGGAMGEEGGGEDEGGEDEGAATPFRAGICMHPMANTGAG